MNRLEPSRMTGPEHFCEAERLLSVAGDLQADEEDASTLPLVHRAQVHATLALAAAVGGLDAHEGPGGGSATGRSVEDERGWRAIVEGRTTSA